MYTKKNNNNSKCSDCLRALLAPTCSKRKVGLRPLVTWQKRVLHSSVPKFFFCFFLILSRLVWVQLWKHTADCSKSKKKTKLVVPSASDHSLCLIHKHKVWNITEPAAGKKLAVLWRERKKTTNFTSFTSFRISRFLPPSLPLSSVAPLTLTLPATDPLQRHRSASDPHLRLRPTDSCEP